MNRFRKVSVRVRDVVFPFVGLVGLNVLVLLTWSLFDPLVWTREAADGHEDEFGPATVSAASCKSSNQATDLVLFTLLGLINLCAILVANRECYKARGHSTRFNESHFVAMTMISLLELAILVLPILFCWEMTLEQDI